jgi:dihydrofolate reductase
MGKVILDITMSLDGFIAGPNDGPQLPLGEGGERLFWVYEGSPFTFVTDGVESAVEQAKAVAGDKNVGVGAASIAQQCIRAALLDEIQIHLAPVLLGGDVRLFDHLGTGPIELESTRVKDTPGVTHLRFRVAK